VSDDNLGNSEAAQDNPVWVAWKQPDRIDAQIDVLFRAVMTLPVEADPMPASGRHSDAMLEWMNPFFGWYFPEYSDLADPANADVLDQFVCWIGQAFVRRAGAVWVSEPEGAPQFYSNAFSPAVAFPYAPELVPENIVGLLADPHPDILEEDAPDFPVLWAAQHMLSARVGDYDYEMSTRQ